MIESIYVAALLVIWFDSPMLITAWEVLKKRPWEARHEDIFVELQDLTVCRFPLGEMMSCKYCMAFHFAFWTAVFTGSFLNTLLCSYFLGILLYDIRKRIGP